MRIAVSLALTAAALMATPRAACAADPDPATVSAVEKQVVPSCVKAIGLLGNGKTDEAIDSLQPLMARPLKKEKGPFGDSELQSWRRLFEFFKKTTFEFETVDLMEIHAISNKAYRISFVGNGKLGPVLFRYRLFQHRGKFLLSNIHFDTNWDRIEFHVAAMQKKLYKRFDLPAVQSADRAKAAKRN